MSTAHDDDHALDSAPTNRIREQVEQTRARHAGQTDPTAGEKLDRLLAKNALTSLGARHPANVSRAVRRANKIRTPLSDTHRDLKRRALGQDGEA